MYGFWDHNDEYAPTPEQLDAIESFNSGQDCKIEARAGSGKTTTLQFMTEKYQKKGIYLAFNRKTSNEADEKFPNHILCKTIHSLAWKYIQSKGAWKFKKVGKKVGPKELVDIVNISPISLDHATLDECKVAHFILKTVEQFCHSNKDSISFEHIPNYPFFLTLSYENRREIYQYIIETSQDIWKRIIDPRDSFPISHDHYLKIWALEKPRIEHDVILIDEAQDLNPTMIDVLARQEAQKVFVGDSHQQIYEWRGAVNALAKVATPHTKYLTQSFRFGTEIASLANAVLKKLGDARGVLGTESIISRIDTTGHSDAILARTNAGVIAETLLATDEGRRPHIQGGTRELERLVKDVYSLKDGKPAQHPDFYGFTSWSDVLQFSEREEGEYLRPFVSLVQKKGERAIYAAIRQVSNCRESSDVTISTVHKAKGAEWDSVLIANDFFNMKALSQCLPEDELRLFYVAITRARSRLLIEQDLLKLYTDATE